MQATQKHEMLQHWNKVGFLWDIKRIWCIFQLPQIVSQLNGLDLSISPTFTFQKHFLIFLCAFEWATWYLLVSNFRNLTISSAFYNFFPWSLICSFLTSFLSKVLAPSTSPFPWLVAKKFQIISQPISKSLEIVKEGYRKTKYKAFIGLNWPLHPLLQTKWNFGEQPCFFKCCQCNMKACCTNNMSCIMSFNSWVKTK